MLDRLPYEIFRQIIRQSLDVSGTRFMLYDSDGLGPLPPIRMSHVCRSWRTALLSDPTMWTWISIPEMVPDQITEFLHRSGSAPLKVVIYASIATVALDMNAWCFRTTTVTPVFKEIHRIQSLELAFSQDRSQPMEALLRQILLLLNQSAPTLEKLFLALKPGPGDRNILQTLFSGDTPRLKHMYHRIITGFSELLPSPLFRNLASLHLDLIAHRITIDYDSLLHVLELSPGLRAFELVTVGDPNPVFHMPTRPARRVHLPFLQSLMLLGNPATEVTDFLLGHLTFPFGTLHYHIDGGNLQRKRCNLTSLIRLLAQRRHSSLSMLTRSPDFHTRIELECRSGGRESSVFTTSFNCRYEPLDKFPSFLQILKLSDIVHFHLKGLPLEAHILRKIFVGLVNLEHLVIEHDVWANGILADRTHSVSPIAFFMALMPLPLVPQGFDPNLNTAHGSDDLNSDNSFPCPSLSTIEIIFGHCVELKLNEHYANLIVVCCSVRRNASHPFKHICIRPSPGTLTQEAENVLLHNKDCPVDILPPEETGMEVDD